MKMQEKASLAAYLSSGFLVLVGKVGKWFNDLTLNDWAIVIGNITSDQVAGQIDTTNRAQSTQADKYVGGLQDVVAMGAGQKADALSGFNSIANTSMQKAQSDAQRSMSNRQATAGLAGALGGAVVRTYGLQDATASASNARSTGVFAGGNSGGQYGVSNTPFGKSTFN